MKKFWIKATIFILILLIPVATLLGLLAWSGKSYEQTYYAGLSIQYDRLNSINEQKIVVVGGSNVAFGLDTELLERWTGKKVVNFGLYGSLGVKVMIDLSKTNLNRGDIVVLTPELSNESYSLYFGAESVLKSTEGRFDILSKIAFDNYDDVLAGSFAYLNAKLGYKKNDETIALEQEDIYKKSSFNEYGDVAKGLRTANVMSSGYLDFAPFSIDVGDEFVNYVNDYVNWCSLRGVKVYFSFAPCNQRALESVYSSEQWQSMLQELYSALSKRLNCPIISDPASYVYDYRYFYDTNFHLNDSGVVLRTVQLAKDVNLFENNVQHVTTTLPEPPEHAPKDVVLDDALLYTNDDYFEYEQDTSGALVLMRVKSEYASLLEEVVVPVKHDGMRVKTIASNAFSECDNLKKITIPTGIMEIKGTAFANCYNLTHIFVMAKSQSELHVAPDTFASFGTDFEIVLVNGEVSAFANGYEWSIQGKYLTQGEWQQPSNYQKGELWRELDD